MYINHLYDYFANMSEIQSHNFRSELGSKLVYYILVVRYHYQRSLAHLKWWRVRVNDCISNSLYFLNSITPEILSPKTLFKIIQIFEYLLIKSHKLTDCNLHPVGFIVFSISKKLNYWRILIWANLS